ncbi:MAG: periplasmic mercuric ion binding protein [Bacteroidales bacterium]|jgi:copper chaperone CopZ|nr:periplasmic mercuric ion binding protein [Bacteroidales bacterium]MDN5329416.1 periplasmic mercuric ion binding protein [Bacteroidales bacterium]
MKKLAFYTWMALTAIMILSVGKVFGTNPDTVWIRTSAQCEMCKETIEKALAYEKGVISSDLDLKTKKVKVVYSPAKTSPEKIRKAISASGYDADEVAADPKAYKRLPSCCKKPQDR